MAKEQAAGNYYRACAAEMMAKAQSAPSKATRQAYLNLALNWVQKASEPDAGTPIPTPTPAAGKKI